MFSLAQAIDAMGAAMRPERDTSLRLAGVSTDSRTIEPGELFVALDGPNFKGADFVAAAAAKGAGAAVVNSADVAALTPDDLPILAVDDTLHALGELARWWRGRFDIPVLAVTGSNGKTSTKQLIGHMLEKLHGENRVCVTKGNFNNLIGVPHTLFRLRENHRIAVIEMGMNHPGEIARLAVIADPGIGLVTNVGPAHLEGLGSIEGVAKAKGELVDYLGADDQFVYYAEDPYLEQMSETYSGTTIAYGRSAHARVRLVGRDKTTAGWRLSVDVGGQTVTLTTSLPGDHQALNLTAALAAGLALGFAPDACAEALAGANPVGGRFVVIDLPRGIRAVDDSYNANPASMAAAFGTLAEMQAGRRIAVLGDIFELGDEASELHRETGSRAAVAGLDGIYAVGNHAADYADGAKSAGLNNGAVVVAREKSELAARLAADLRDGDVVLFKGSRGAAMEEVLAQLRVNLGEEESRSG